MREDRAAGKSAAKHGYCHMCGRVAVETCTRCAQGYCRIHVGRHIDIITLSCPYANRNRARKIHLGQRLTKCVKCGKVVGQKKMSPARRIDLPKGEVYVHETCKPGVLADIGTVLAQKGTA